MKNEKIQTFIDTSYFTFPTYCWLKPSIFSTCLLVFCWEIYLKKKSHVKNGVIDDFVKFLCVHIFNFQELTILIKHFLLSRKNIFNPISYQSIFYRFLYRWTFHDLRDMYFYLLSSKSKLDNLIFDSRTKINSLTTVWNFRLLETFLCMKVATLYGLPSVREEDRYLNV